MLYQLTTCVWIQTLHLKLCIGTLSAVPEIAHNQLGLIIFFLPIPPGAKWHLDSNVVYQVLDLSAVPSMP